MKSTILKFQKTKKLAILFVFLSVLVSCSKDDDKDEEPVDEEPAPTTLVGQDGNPRFNLVFTNEAIVDLDLYVKAPNGTIVYYANPSGAGGTLDVDCLCNSCPQGPNENIFWQTGQAPAGQYEYWVKYFGSCGGTTNQSSNFTIRTIRNGVVLETKTGTLSSGESQRFIHVQQ